MTQPGEITIETKDAIVRVVLFENGYRVGRIEVRPDGAVRWLPYDGRKDSRKHRQAPGIGWRELKLLQHHLGACDDREDRGRWKWINRVIGVDIEPDWSQPDPIRKRRGRR